MKKCITRHIVIPNLQISINIFLYFSKLKENNFGRWRCEENINIRIGEMMKKRGKDNFFTLMDPFMSGNGRLIKRTGKGSLIQIKEIDIQVYVVKRFYFI